MIEIYDNLYVGSDHDCQSQYGNCAIVHSCKTCHKKALGYEGNLKPADPNYLIFEQAQNLFLNLVDMQREFMPLYTDPIMKKAMEFIDNNIKDTPVLIHCNQGASRAPSIGLLYLAKKGMISNHSYALAAAEFRNSYAPYNPGRGIALYLQNNWDRLIREL